MYPVLLTSGRCDITIGPSVVASLHANLKSSEWIIFPHSGHMTMIDDAKMMNEEAAVLRRVVIGYDGDVVSKKKSFTISDEIHDDIIDRFVPIILTCLQVLIIFIIGFVIGRFKFKNSRIEYHRIL